MTNVAHAGRPPIRVRMSAPLRKAVLLLHIVGSMAWIGIDVVMAMLIFGGLFSEDRYREMINYGALGTVIFWPLIVAAMLSLVSGLMLGAGSKYGLARYWWVLIKLLLNVVLAALVLFALRPSLVLAGDFAELLAAGEQPDEAALQSLLYPPIVSAAALLLAGVLAVFKPWGRIRRRDRRPER